MTPLVAFSLVEIPIVTILSLGAVRYMWRLWQKDRQLYRLVDRRRVTLALILAVVTTVAFIAGLMLAVPTIAFVMNASLEVRRVTGNLVLVAIDVLLPLPLVVALYLRSRE